MLTYQITDFSGKVLCTLWRRGKGEVRRPVNDSCTAKVDLSIYQPEIKHVKPLQNHLKVLFYDLPVFWGPILTPQYTFDTPGESIVEINAHDPSLAWKKNYLRFGDFAVDVGFPLDGLGITFLAEAAIPSVAQINRGVKHPGILFGEDTTTPAGNIPAGGVKPGQTAGRWARATRGQNIWEAMSGLWNLPLGLGFDWNLKPIDAENPGVVFEWEPGFFCEFNRYYQRLEDRRADLRWEKSFGKNNLEKATWTPDGDKVKNYAVVVFQGGEDSAADRVKRRVAHLESEWRRVGIYESWEAANLKKYYAPALQEEADYTVKTYGVPPDFLTITTRQIGSPGVYVYTRDFTEGDLCTVALKQGYVTEELDVRINTVTLKDTGHGSGVSQDLDVVPQIDPSVDQNEQ